MNKQLFEKYAELKIKSSSIEEELDGLKPQILDELASVEDNPVELDGVGTFVVTKRKTWTYTDIYNDLKLKLKDREKEEQAKGLASFKEDRTVMFKPIKDLTN